MFVARLQVLVRPHKPQPVGGAILADRLAARAQGGSALNANAPDRAFVAYSLQQRGLAEEVAILVGQPAE